MFSFPKHYGFVGKELQWMKTYFECSGEGPLNASSKTPLQHTPVSAMRCSYNILISRVVLRCTKYTAKRHVPHVQLQFLPGPCFFFPDHAMYHFSLNFIFLFVWPSHLPRDMIWVCCDALYLVAAPIDKLAVFNGKTSLFVDLFLCHVLVINLCESQSQCGSHAQSFARLCVI